MISRSHFSQDLQDFVRIEAVTEPHARIQDLGWTQLECTSKIIRIDVENASFGYNLTVGNLNSDGFAPVARGPPDF